jgi:nitroreductase
MKTLIISLIFFSTQLFCFSQDKLPFDTIKLTLPDKNKGIPVMQALNQRKTTRELSDKKLSIQQLSELLWAANGVNREDGKRTAPAAMNKQFVDIYLVLQEGIYIYDPIKNRLIPFKEGDFRKETGSQEFVSIAPVTLVFVSDLAKIQTLPAQAANLSKEDKLKWAYIGAGCMAENVHLYCSSEGLGAVVRGSIDGQKFGKIMNMRSEQEVLFAQTVGFLNKE